MITGSISEGFDPHNWVVRKRHALTGDAAEEIVGKPGCLLFTPEDREAGLTIGMPRMDGFERCRRLRQMPGLGKVVIAAVSGYGSEDDQSKSKEAGSRHLVKPIGRVTLEELVKIAGRAHSGASPGPIDRSVTQTSNHVSRIPLFTEHFDLLRGNSRYQMPRYGFNQPLSGGAVQGRMTALQPHLEFVRWPCMRPVTHSFRRLGRNRIRERAD